MPFVLVVAFAGSLALHALALFGADLELPGSEPEPLVLHAELRMPLPPPAVPDPVQAAREKKPRPLKKVPLTRAAPDAVSLPPAPELMPVVETPPEEQAPEVSTSPLPTEPLLPASGAIRYAIYKTSIGMQVGRAEHRWEFDGEGHYRLTAFTETSGLAALIKPVRVDMESQGRLVAGGLQPESYRTRKQRGDEENADFDWSTGQVRLSRDGGVASIVPGTQDLLSLIYQLAYLPRPEEGSSIGVVTGRKYDRYELDSLGEELIEVPVGQFRTLHLRAVAGNTMTEIWIALDDSRLPVKIRFTDKKGDSFEQVATEIAMKAKVALP
ncbi:DUF3108 domain-containing protein [Quatrionicoccus australiensis]|uniref:DUF3108 domain-containing protein n=1 Tax=Quatrionicoccus australiensis TaxID=138118 RepID=UPI001CF9B54B|nr:DUF3108 domain-containing protein [Quatrionicoccus australiensis]MCB4361162.1 DUF3108 domain-containing protein [Quatrionicoccus australiensis]